MRIRFVTIVTLSLLAVTCGDGDRQGEPEPAGAPTTGTSLPAPEEPAANPASAGVAAAVDPGLPPYRGGGTVSGNLNSIGSDTLNNLMTLWAEEFRRLYPSVKPQIEGKGSSTAPPALIEGTAQLGPMSREMKPTEVDAFERAFGYKPTALRVAIDALAVYVHRDNPLEKLTLPEVDTVFSKARACGHPQDIQTWGQLGVSGPLVQRPISLYGRNSASGTYGYFKEHALCKGDFRDSVKEQPGSASVVQGITSDVAGIGYSGIGYRTSGVKPLALAKTQGGPYTDTSSENVLSGAYPLSRYLYVYVNRAPNKPMDPLTREFLRFVLSAQGQEVVIKDGYMPLPETIASKERLSLE